MNRRDALKSLLVLSGSVTVFGADRFLAGNRTGAGAATAARFNPTLLALLDEVAETIIPETPDSGGGKAAQIGLFMAEIVTDYYDVGEQQRFFAGAEQIDDDATARFSTGFLDLSPAQRTELFMTYENAARAPDGYRMLKQLTTWGYFSSEVGMTQALAFDPIPARFDGDLPLEPGQKAWSG